MSSKDRATVRNQKDPNALAAYFSAKGKPIPDWAQRELRNYWGGQDLGFDIVRKIIRALRPAAIESPADSELRKHYADLAGYQALEPLLAQVPDADLNAYAMKLRKRLVTLLRTQTKLENKLGLKVELWQSADPLDTWELSLPKPAAQA